MNRVNGWAAENREKWWFCAALNIIVLVLCVVLALPRFETNDDFVFVQIYGGSYGTRSAYSVYQNILMGYLNVFLYSLFPSIPWYTFLQYIFIFVSLTCITNVLIRRLKSNAGIWIALVVAAVYGYLDYIYIQYTKTAGLLTAAGCLLLFHAAGEKKLSVRGMIAGILLCAFGFMTRRDSFFQACAMMAGIGLLLLSDYLHNRKEKGRGGRHLSQIAQPEEDTGRKYLRHLPARLFFEFGIMVLCVICLDGCNRYAYQSDPGWKSYLEFNEARTILTDYRHPDYESNKELYDSAGMTKSAYDNLFTWDFTDPEVFTKEALETLAEASKPEPFTVHTVVQYFRSRLARSFFGYTGFRCLLIFAVCFLLFGRHDRRAVAAAIFEFIVFNVLYLYLFYRGRYLTARVDNTFWLTFSLYLIWIMKPGCETIKGSEYSGKPTPVQKKKRFPGMMGRILIICLFSVNALFTAGKGKSVLRNSAESKNTLAAASERKDEIERIAADQDHFYLSRVGSFSSFSAYMPFDVVPEGILSNQISLGGWDTCTPDYWSFLESHGVTNPFRDMVDSEDVLLIDSNVDLTLSYIRDYYAKDASAVKVDEADGVPVYHIISSPQ